MSRLSSVDVHSGIAQSSPIFGIGLRKPHFDELSHHHKGVDFLEIVSDNFMRMGGKEHAVLDQLKDIFPMILHGVGLSIGSPDPLNQDYLAALNELIQFVKPIVFSDHLCFSSGYGVEYNDLIPLPFTREAVKHLVPRIQEVKKLADIPFLLENRSYYVRMPGAEMSEQDFIGEILEQGDCGILLDVNNVYVNSQNHRYDPYAFIDAIPAERVYQYHMAGHYNGRDVLIDTHGDHVIDAVMKLYQYTLKKVGPRPTLLEWDNDIPPLSILLKENDKIRKAASLILDECGVK